MHHSILMLLQILLHPDCVEVMICLLGLAAVISRCSFFFFFCPYQLCEEALRVSSCCTAGNAVPIVVQKRLVATWVELKQLSRQQIGSTMDAVDKVPFLLGYGEVWPSMAPGYQTQMMS